MGELKKIFSQRCWINGKLQPATVCIEKGRISAIHFERMNDAEDLGNSVIMPGIIDAHVHVNEPGRTEWEGFETATSAAAAGGITTIVDMPLNASPVTTTADAFKQKLEASKGKLHVNCGFYAGLIPGNLHELEPLMDAGVLGVKCFLTHSGIDEFPNVSEADVDAAMPVIAKHKIPLLAHCEIYDKEAECALEEFPGSYSEYLASRPRKWENDAINLMIRLCEKHHCPTHIVHVSSSDALESISQAKTKGLPLTAETCAHYIYFNAEDIPDNDTLYKCAPPIREKENNDRLKTALKNGVLDFITTDHSPSSPAVKELESGNLKKAWGGIAGLQFLLPVSWSALKDNMSLEQFIPLLTEHPALFLKTEHSKGYIREGYDADLLVWDPEESFTVDRESILHRHPIGPYTGRTLFGKVQQTYVNGTLVYNKENIINKNAGQWLLKK